MLLIGDFNENIYSGALATALAGDDLCMSELCYRTTGTPLPPTHNRGSVSIDALYSTAGPVCSAVALLPDRMGVDNNRVFIMDIELDSILGDVFPHVLPAARRLLNCALDHIENKYIQVLNQLSNRHLIFKKLLVIDQASSTISRAQVQLRMNKVDLELKQFMKSSKQTCHKFIQANIEWSPQAGVWIHRRWLLAHVQNYLAGKTRDPRNLFKACKKRGVTNPCQITHNKLRTEFFVCKSNLELLAKHCPHYRHKHLHSLVAADKQRGDLTQASKIVGILQKEACQKRWRQVNRSMHKARGGLTVAVKIPTVGDGYVEYKTQEGVFQAVSATLVERFQSALVAQCHRGTFFKDVGHLADGPAAQQILEGTYVYPPDLDPATRLLFEEAAHTYATLSPMEITTDVTTEDFQHFWQTARERTGSFYSGLHFGHYIAASFCPDLLV
jgi:hypothetical protein